MKIITFLFIISFLFYASFSMAQVEVSRTVNLMGSVFQITVVGSNTVSAQQNIDKVIVEMERIENLISEWRPHTQISQVNQNAGIRPVQLSS